MVEASIFAVTPHFGGFTLRPHGRGEWNFPIESPSGTIRKESRVRKRRTVRLGSGFRYNATDLDVLPLGMVLFVQIFSL